ncbi:TadE/TadG family type IV pilus assembly protein [Streptomyces sp. NRRL S-350]|uniref:TadE/TadG family type IV pilus assembly protein n=1 Tax=Streptomyces sp. NRRL S-350 TaxID=1463902 RepID=UPI00068E4AC5|nr:TadE family protein [Streptomyces sp. NRRL S-350]
MAADRVPAPPLREPAAIAAGRGLRRWRGDAGISALELVIIAPVLMLLILFLITFGQITHARSTLDGTARDAARAGALQRDYQSAVNAATRSAQADAGRTCADGRIKVSAGGNFEPGGLFTITVSCEVKGLAMLGSTVRDISATAAAPLDVYRRVVQ